MQQTPFRYVRGPATCSTTPTDGPRSHPGPHDEDAVPNIAAISHGRSPPGRDHAGRGGEARSDVVAHYSAHPRHQIAPSSSSCFSVVDSLAGPSHKDTHATPRLQIQTTLSEPPGLSPSSTSKSSTGSPLDPPPSSTYLSSPFENKSAVSPTSRGPAAKKFDIRIADIAASGGVRPKRARVGKERTKLDLAPDQPPTTQGKERERVYVACLQCRSRKIRCNGERPMCYNCRQRETGACVYDSVPKRRGPDKCPGARHRVQKEPGDGAVEDGAEPKRRRRRRSSEDAAAHAAAAPARVASREPVGALGGGVGRARENSDFSEASFASSVEETFSHPMAIPALPANHLSPIEQGGITYDGGALLMDRARSGSISGQSGVESAHGDSASMSPQTDSSQGHNVDFLVDSRTQMNGLPCVGRKDLSISPHTEGVRNELDGYVLGPDPSSVSTYTSLVSPQYETGPFENRAYGQGEERTRTVGNYDPISPLSVPPLSAHEHMLGSPVSAMQEYYLARDQSVLQIKPEPAYPPSRRLSHPAIAVRLPEDVQSGEIAESYLPELGPIASNVNPYLFYSYDYPQDPMGLNVDMNPEAYISVVIEDYEEEPRGTRDNIVHAPTLDFVRKTWWDSLLELYASAPSTESPRDALVAAPLSAAARERTAQQVTVDLQFLFRTSNFWFAFVNVPLFFATFCDARAREGMQPALLLAALAVSTFFRSSEAELGARGRTRALWLRDKAQAALEASVNAQWIEPALAQAAWLLALFEISLHPSQSCTRASSAFGTLDSIIRTLSLTNIDAEDPSVSKFDPRAVPRVQRQPEAEVLTFPLPLYTHSAQAQAPGTATFGYTGTPAAPVCKRRCSCTELSLGKNWAQAHDHTPLWLSTPAWGADWTVAQIRQEECRRLAWSALTLTAGYTSYTTALKLPTNDLFMVQPWNYRLLFPGENLARSPGFDSSHPAKDTVWALYARAMLLWNSCVRMRGENMSDHERAQFANAVWLEADAIETALNAHTCNSERAFLFQGREYLFNSRMCISYEFRRFVPYPNVSGQFHRRKAEEWLTHQAGVAQRVMHGLAAVTGQKNNILAQRPFFIYWFMGQIARCLQLWSFDKTLTIAIQVSKSLLPPIDYLTALWPCNEQRTQYAAMRHQLDQACQAAGLPPPPPLDFTFPPPCFPEVLV